LTLDEHEEVLISAGKSRAEMFLRVRQMRNVPQDARIHCFAKMAKSEQESRIAVDNLTHSIRECAPRSGAWELAGRRKKQAAALVL